MRTAKRPDPTLPDESGKERTDETVAPINLANPVELIVLSVKQKAARCRLRGSAHTVTLRAGGLWDVVPGEIAVVRPRKQWIYARNPYLSGEIESTRLDVQALGLAPLKLEERGMWDSSEHYWGEEGEPIEDWAKQIIAWGSRPEFEMEQVLPGADAEDPFSDPIIESNDLKDGGDIEGANRILMDLCQADLRCLDAHAHLGNIAFDHWPEIAIRHYEVGFRNVVFLGPPGVGKTHLSVALAEAAIQSGFGAYFMTAHDLVTDLGRAYREGRLDRRMWVYLAPKVLIIDEMGYLPLDELGATIFFQLVSARYERGSIILTSNKSYGDWGSIFGDPIIATAILDRLLHHSTTINIRGESYRLKDRRKAGLFPRPQEDTGQSAPFLSRDSLQNGPRRQGSASPRKTSAPLTAPGRSTD